MELRSRWLVALVALASCTISVPLDGKRCAQSEPRCVEGYVCVDDFCVQSGGAAGGSVAGGAAGGSIAGGSAGGSIAGGSAGGSIAGGSAGGSIAGGSAGGSIAGGSAGGSIAGGSAGGSIAGGSGGGSIAGGSAGGSIAGGSAGGTSDGGCPFDIDPAAAQCPVGRLWYLSPTGNDSLDALSPANARLTLPASIGMGDRVVLLAGNYSSLSFSPSHWGLGSCPRVITGDLDGGTVLTRTLVLQAPTFVVLRNLVFRPLADDGVRVTGSGARGLTIQNARFEGQQSDGGQIVYPFDVNLQECESCVVRNSTFQSDEYFQLVEIDGANFALRGNLIQLHRGGPGYVNGAGARIEGNTFVGSYTDRVLRIQGPNARLALNVFDQNDTEYDQTLIEGTLDAGLIATRNTFRLPLDQRMRPFLIVDRFENNLVLTGRRLVNAATLASPGRYNIFTSVVQTPYINGAPSPTDLVADVFVDSNLVPLAGQPAIDAADPTLPVPPGGGARADVGAREFGTTRTSDGRYCTADAG